MKATGVVRKIDELGRIVIPKEIRSTLGWETKVDGKDGTSLEIFLEGERVIFGKYNPGCVLCGSIHDLTRFREKNICESCIEELK